MSDDIILTIIERASKDETFRQLLFENPAVALEEYELSAETRSILENLDADTFDAFAGKLGGRTTKGMWRPGG